MNFINVEIGFKWMNNPNMNDELRLYMEQYSAEWCGFETGPINQN